MTEGLCVVVGSGPTLGLAIAKRFGKEGFRVAMFSRRSAWLDDYVAELQAEGIDAYGYGVNPADYQSLRSAFERAHEELGETDVLIYNAAIARPVSACDLDVSTFLYDFSVNVAGALVAAQQVIPHMRRRGQGAIIFTGGGVALTPDPQYASLGMGKAALRNLAYCLGDELEVEGVHVAIVTVPGFVAPGGPYEPDDIADLYWELYRQEPLRQEREIVLR